LAFQTLFLLILILYIVYHALIPYSIMCVVQCGMLICWYFYFTMWCN